LNNGRKEESRPLGIGSRRHMANSPWEKLRAPTNALNSPQDWFSQKVLYNVHVVMSNEKLYSDIDWFLLTNIK